jgi:hypothetical protein
VEIEYLKVKNELIKRMGIIRFIFIILVLLSAAWAVYIYVTPVVYKEEYIASSCTHTAEYTYTVPVTLSNPLYLKGTELEGMPAYFFSVSPTVDISFKYHLAASDSGQADIIIKSYILATSKSSDEVFWEKKLPIESVSPQSSDANGNVIQSFTINVPDVQAQVKSLQDQIGYSQGTEIKVLSIVSYEGLVNGRTVDESKEFSFPLTISNSYYQMPDELEFTDTDDFYMTRTVKEQAGLEEMKYALMLLVGSILLFIVTGFIKNLEVTDEEYIRELEIKRDNSKFDEWISMGQFPSNAAFPEIRVDSLQGLVDIAADMDGRVIKDSEKNVYFLVKDGIMYLYS